MITDWNAKMDEVIDQTVDDIYQGVTYSGTNTVHGRRVMTVGEGSTNLEEHPYNIGDPVNITDSNWYGYRDDVLVDGQPTFEQWDYSGFGSTIMGDMHVEYKNFYDVME